jgi:hypothetical protein
MTLRVPDQILDGAPGVVEVHEQVPGRLGDPRRARVSGGAEDPYAAGGVFDGGQNVQAGAGQRHGLEEVRGEDGMGLRTQERRPGSPARWGAGSIPASCRISHTVEAATVTPRTTDSPWIVRYPQVQFWRARRSTSRRIDRMVRGGRPAFLGRRSSRAGRRSGYGASAAQSPAAPATAVRPAHRGATGAAKRRATPGQPR